MRRKWLFRLAALYATEEGTLNALARAIGRTESTLHVILAEDRPAHSVCKAIEDLVGEGVFPRYLGMYGE